MRINACLPGIPEEPCRRCPVLEPPWHQVSNYKPCSGCRPNSALPYRRAPSRQLIEVHPAVITRHRKFNLSKKTYEGFFFNIINEKKRGK